MLIPCQCCNKMYPSNFNWYICGECGYRVCTFCLNKHTGKYSHGGYKCSQCMFGYMEYKTNH